jgi:hypothetical protein
VGRGAVNSFRRVSSSSSSSGTTIVIISTNETHLTHTLLFPAAGCVWSRASRLSVHPVVVLHRISSFTKKQENFSSSLFAPSPPYHIRKEAEGKAGRVGRKRRKWFYGLFGEWKVQKQRRTKNGKKRTTLAIMKKTHKMTHTSREPPRVALLFV